MTLVIMAAGMGSRFGGLKQIEPVNENKEFIIDYSIYDAIKAGFTKIVFISTPISFKIPSTIGLISFITFLPFIIYKKETKLTGTNHHICRPSC